MILRRPLSLLSICVTVALVPLIIVSYLALSLCLWAFSIVERWAFSIVERWE